MLKRYQGSTLHVRPFYSIFVPSGCQYSMDDNVLSIEHPYEDDERFNAMLISFRRYRERQEATRESARDRLENWVRTMTPWSMEDGDVHAFDVPGGVAAAFTCRQQPDERCAMEGAPGIPLLRHVCTIEGGFAYAVINQMIHDPETPEEAWDLGLAVMKSFAWLAGPSR